jgi:hypothetical protein
MGDRMPGSRRPFDVVARLLCALALALSAQLIATDIVRAGCYGSNEGAFRTYTGHLYARGVRSTVDLYAATPLSGQSAIVHPLQLASSSSADFLGWGTAKGVGTTGGSTNCPDDFSGWNVYVDGMAFGVYFCEQTYGALADTAQNQVFTIVHESSAGCAGAFDMYLNGVSKTCRVIDGTNGQVSAGAESIGTTETQLIDVHYESKNYNNPSTGWQPWGAQAGCANAGYRNRVLSSTNHYSEVAP